MNSRSMTPDADQAVAAYLNSKREDILVRAQALRTADEVDAQDVQAAIREMKGRPSGFRRATWISRMGAILYWIIPFTAGVSSSVVLVGLGSEPQFGSWTAAATLGLVVTLSGYWLGFRKASERLEPDRASERADRSPAGPLGVGVTQHFLKQYELLERELRGTGEDASYVPLRDAVRNHVAAGSIDEGGANTILELVRLRNELVHGGELTDPDSIHEAGTQAKLLLHALRRPKTQKRGAEALH